MVIVISLYFLLLQGMQADFFVKKYHVNTLI